MSTSQRNQHRGNARLRQPERHQIAYRDVCWDQLLSENHVARDVWAFCQNLDLSELYVPIKATVGKPGRDKTEPRVLFALWLLATIEGRWSARNLEKLTERDLAYIWMRGEVPLNHHMLSDFRVQHGDLLEKTLTDSIAVLHQQGLIKLQTIGHDGMRVRASAGSSSFRKADSLEEALVVAKAHVEEVRRQEAENQDEDLRRQAARRRAACEKQQRIEHALLELEDLQRRHDKRGKNNGTQQRGEPRASTTDPEARRMKMGDGGIRPAMNVQFASDGDAQVIVGVEVTSQGSDAGLMKPMFEHVCHAYGVVPENYLVDGGFNKKTDIGYLENQGTKVFAPLYLERKQLADGKDPYQARAGESKAMTQHRQRMGTEEGKAMRKRRSQIAEFPNAVCRNDGLTQFRVRGLAKAKAQTLWHALAHNFRRFNNLVCPTTKRTYMEILMAD